MGLAIPEHFGFEDGEWSVPFAQEHGFLDIQAPVFHAPFEDGIRIQTPRDHFWVSQTNRRYLSWVRIRESLCSNYGTRTG